VVSTAAALEMKPPPAPRWGQQRDPSDEISIAGVLVGMRAAKSKRNDKMYAQGHLEDSYGKIEVICFAKDYEKLAEQLKTEAAVLVRGTLIGEEESAPKLAISGLQPLDDVQVKLPTGVRLRLNLDIASEELFATLKAQNRPAPGPGKLMMHLQKKGQLRSRSRAGRHESSRRPHLGRVRRSRTRSRRVRKSPERDTR
jgi:DNA polymerase-3 subunit alpha